MNTTTIYCCTCLKKVGAKFYILIITFLKKIFQYCKCYRYSIKGIFCYFVDFIQISFILNSGILIRLFYCCRKYNSVENVEKLVALGCRVA